MNIWMCRWRCRWKCWKLTCLRTCADLFVRLAHLHAHLFIRLARLHAHLFIPYFLHPYPFQEFSVYRLSKLAKWYMFLKQHLFIWFHNGFWNSWSLPDSFVMHPRKIYAFCWFPTGFYLSFQHGEKLWEIFPQPPWDSDTSPNHRPTLEDFTEFIYTKICMGLFEDVKVCQSLGGRMAEVKLDIVHLMIVMILVMNLTIMIRWFSEKQQETDGNWNLRGMCTHQFVWWQHKIDMIVIIFIKSTTILLMAEILHHLGCMKPYK